MDDAEYKSKLESTISEDNVYKYLVEELADAIKTKDMAKAKLLFYVLYAFFDYVFGFDKNEITPQSITSMSKKMNIDEEHINLIIRTYREIYGSFQKPDESQYPQDVLVDIHTKVKGIISAFNRPYDFVRFEIVDMIARYPPTKFDNFDIDAFGRFVVVWSKHKKSVEGGFVKLLSTGYTPSQLVGGILLLSKQNQSSNSTSLAKFQNAVSYGVFLYFSMGKVGFDAEITRILSNFMKIDLNYSPDKDAMAKALSEKFLVAQAKFRKYKDTINALVNLGVLSKESNKSLRELLSHSYDAILMSGKLFAENSKDVFPENKYTKNDFEDIKKNALESYLKTSYINSGEKPIDLVLTSNEWEYHEVKNGTVKQNPSNSDEIVVNQFIEKYYIIPGYIILDSGYGYYIGQGVYLRANVANANNSNGAADEKRGQPYVNGLIEDSTLYFSNETYKH